jgi:membrane-associated phospholipid phosphatase
MPLLGVALVFYFTPIPQGYDIAQISKILFLLLFFNTAVLPGASFFIMYKTKLITSVELNKREERFIPFLITLFFYGITYGFLRNAMLPDAVFIALAGSILVVFSVMFASLFYKISIHMAGIGGIVGLAIATFWVYGTFNVYALSALFIAAGLTGWARLKLNAHTPFQVYTGFIAGFLIMFGTRALGLYF